MDRPPHHSIDSVIAARGQVYAGAAAAFIALAIWGSWFPFVLRPVPFDVAIAMLRWSAAPELFSLTDALSNLLLFIPIGVFVAAAAGRGTRRHRVSALAFGAALSLMLELGQLLVPWRIPSVLDIAAESAGLITGLILWRVAGAELNALIERLIKTWHRTRPVDRALWIYAAAFAVAWLLPFDFTLRPDEIVDKYWHQRLLLPWMVSPDEATTSQLLVTGAAAVPLGWLAVTGTGDTRFRRGALIATANAAAVLVLLTLVQVTVFSRTTDTALTLAAMGGAAKGAVTAARLTRRAVRSNGRSTVRLIAVAASWMAAVLVVEWWPFHFDLDADRAREQLAMWSFAPFRPAGAAGDVLPGAVVAMAGGVLLARHRHSTYARLQRLGALGVIAVIFAAAEAGRLLIPGDQPTLASVAVKVIAFATTLAVASERRAAIPAATRS